MPNSGTAEFGALAGGRGVRDAVSATKSRAFLTRPYGDATYYGRSIHKF